MNQKIRDNFKATVIYDGSCNLCAGNLKWLKRLDWLGKFDSLPYQSDEVYQRFPKLTRSDCEKAMQVVLPDGYIYSGADAFRKIFLRMPLMMVIGILMAVPPMPWVLRKLYRIFAPYRYHLSGKCPVDSKTNKKHFNF